jgi:hypothetical protein
LSDHFDFLPDGRAALNQPTALALDTIGMTGNAGPARDAELGYLSRVQLDSDGGCWSPISRTAAFARSWRRDRGGRWAAYGTEQVP